VRVFINIDAGESDDEAEELYALAHVVNVACGGHAGDDASMRRVVLACARYGTRVGAHPSYADRAGFGRRALDVSPREMRACVAEQCKRLEAHAAAASAPVLFMKPHGALYHAAAKDRALADAVIQGAADALGHSVTVIGPPDCALAIAAAHAGLSYAREGFADRGVRADGSLVPRGEALALIEDPARAAGRARELAARGDVDTVCVHGDTPRAVAIARAVRAAIDGP
jgi:UPF0271 protein